MQRSDKLKGKYLIDIRCSAINRAIFPAWNINYYSNFIMQKLCSNQFRISDSNFFIRLIYIPVCSKIGRYKS